MMLRLRRARRVLALACALVVGAASAEAAFTLVPPKSCGPSHDQVAAVAELLQDGAAIAPRIGEARPPLVSRAPEHALSAPPTSRAWAACEEWRESGSICNELLRWRLAHATSTQAP